MLIMLRVVASRFVHLLRRIMRRLWAGGWLLLDRAVKMLICKLQVMFRSHGLRVADPLAHDVQWEDLDQFRLAGAA